MTKIGVTSKAFSTNETLVKMLAEKFPNYKLNLTGKAFSQEELIDFLSDCDGCIVALEHITQEVLAKLPKLSFVAKYGVGLDNIDLEACALSNVRVGWKGGVNKFAVAEMTLAFMLMLLRNIYYTSHCLKKGKWIKNGGVSLFGRSVGIIGLGHIGQDVVKLLQPFGCRIMACDIEDKSSFAKEWDVSMVNFETLVTESDVITMHVPKTPLTKNMINKSIFKMMKSTAILINTSRGGIINESDLIDAITQQKIAGAALDVYNEEPLTHEKLYTLDRVICTPHIGGNSTEAVIAMGKSAIEQLESLYSGGVGI